MSWLLYVTEVALVLTCVALLPWMKREGEREWARYQRRLAIQEFQRAFERGLLSLRDAYAQMGLAIGVAAKAMKAMGVAMGLEEKR